MKSLPSSSRFKHNFQWNSKLNPEPNSFNITKKEISYFHLHVPVLSRFDQWGTKDKNKEQEENENEKKALHHSRKPSPYHPQSYKTSNNDC